MQQQPGKRFGILLTMSLVFMLAMGIYYIYTQNVKEAKVKRQAFKTLYRYAGDLKEKEHDLKEMYYSQYKSWYEKLDFYNKIYAYYQSMKGINPAFTSDESNKKLESKLQEIITGLTTISEDRVGEGDTKESYITKLDSSFFQYDNPYYKSVNSLLQMLPFTKEQMGKISAEIANIEIDKSTLFNDVFDYKLFEKYIVLDSKEAVFNELGNASVELVINNQRHQLSADSLIKVLNNKRQISSEGMQFYGIINPFEVQMPITIEGSRYQAFLVKVDGDKVKYLVGLMSYEKYASLKRGFSRRLVSAITLFALLLLLSIPIVKLFVVAPGEVYSVKNLLTLVFSSAGLVFIVVYVILHTSSLIYIEKHINDDGEHLAQISDSIQCHFSSELDFMLDDLKDLDSIIQSNLAELKERDQKRQHQAIENIDKFNNYFRTKVRESQLFASDDSIWQEAFLVRRLRNNKDHDQQEGTHNYGESLSVIYNTNRYVKDDGTVGVSLAHRNYVKEPTRFQKEGLKFGFESIFSLTSVKPQVVVSKPSDDSDYITCLSSEMYSVNNTILPAGYSFCIIDKTGKVWFHSDAKNNLRENLFLETDNSPDLIAAVKSLRLDRFVTDYKMKPTLMRIKPLDMDLGLFIVVMCEINNYQQLVNHTGYIIIGAFIILFLFWMMISWAYRKWSNNGLNIKNPPHTLLLFFPIRKKGFVYKELAIKNFIITIVFSGLTILLNQFIYVIHWYVLLGVVGAALLIRNIVWLQDKEIKRSLLSFTGFFILPLVILTTFEFLWPHHMFDYSFWFSMVLMLLCSALIYFWFIHDQARNYISEEENRSMKLSSGNSTSLPGTYIVKRQLKRWQNWYYTFVFSILVFFVVTPLFVIYTVVYHQETTLHYMQQQRYIADQIITRRLDLLKKDNKPDVIQHFLEQKGNYYAPFHEMKYLAEASKPSQDTLGVVHKKKWKEAKHQSIRLNSTFNYVEVFGRVRAKMFFINNVIEDRGNKIKPTYIDSKDDGKRYSYSFAGDNLRLKVNSGGLPPNWESFNLLMHRPTFGHIPKRFLGFLFGLILIVILFCYYFPKIALYLFPRFKYDQDLFTRDLSAAILHHPQDGEKRYIVTMPDKAFYDKCLKTDDAVLYRLHIKESLEQFLTGKNKNEHVYLFIDHMSFSGINQLSRIVDRIEQMLSDGEFKTLNIVCFRVPRVLINHFKTNLLATLNPKDENYEANKMNLEVDLKRLINVLAYFSMSYVPLLEQPIKTEYHQPIEGDKLKWLEKELGDNAFMQDKVQIFQRQLTISDNQHTKVVNEDNVYQAYLINRTYYQKIWDSCSGEEKSILFDIAQDYVINLHKNGVVNILINKGLILNGQFLKLFNLSFTLFVMRQSDEVDLINADLRAKSKTGWSQYNLPIKLMGVAILIFLLITQQEFLTSMQSIIISVGAILTFVVRFFNFPSRSGITSGG